MILKQKKIFFFFGFFFVDLKNFWIFFVFSEIGFWIMYFPLLIWCHTPRYFGVTPPKKKKMNSGLYTSRMTYRSILHGASSLI